MVLTAITPETDRGGASGTLTKIVMTVEYAGIRYFGFQLQAGNQPTIQGELEKALFRLTGENIRVLAASRTDTGVHALGQVVSFRTYARHAADTYVKALNHYLPPDIAVKSAGKVDVSFDVRKQAVSREYSYHILNSAIRSPLSAGRVHRVEGRLDITAMNEACRHLIGEHNFASFTSGIGGAARNMVRRVYRADFERAGDVVVFHIVAGSFLPHQVRNTVGTLIRVGLGQMSRDDFCSIMAEQRPGLAGPTAPACGLYLDKVNYAQPIMVKIQSNRDITEEERDENL